MKFHLLAAVLAVVTMSGNRAQADWDSSPVVYGDPLVMCSGISFSSNQMKCMEITQGKYFFQSALQVCQNMSFDSEKLNCLSQIANRPFSTAAVSVCAGMSFGSSKLSCLSAIEAKSFDRDLIGVCKSMSFEQEKTDCMKNHANQIFTAPAALLCGQLSFGSEKNSCLDVVKNKSYSPSEITFCSRMTFTSEKLSCLARTGHQIAVILPGSGYSPPGYGGSPSPVVATGCNGILRNIERACRLSPATQGYLLANADLCESGESRSGRTTVNVLARKNSSSAIVINTDGQNACEVKRAKLPSAGHGISDIDAVRGGSRSDKIFFRMNEGQLIVMDMGHDMAEILNSKRRSYNLSRITAVGVEALRITHRGNHQSDELTFREIDELKHQGRVVPITVESGFNLNLILNFGF